MAYPALFQISARDWLARLSAGHASPLNLGEIPDIELQRLAEYGFKWLYLLGIWQTGEQARAISRQNAGWLPGYHAALTQWTAEDVSGSPFAIRQYQVHTDFGGDAALEKLRIRLTRFGIKLMLDFVPNHMAPDHPWVADFPERFMHGNEEDLRREPANYIRVSGGRAILAHGRDPYYPGWVDTTQLDYSHPGTIAAMTAELQRIAGQCDGIRCDMAMLVLPEIFGRTWGRQMQPFWPGAIAAARKINPNFLMMAEVYWGLEWELQKQGFDFTYDKTLYDRLLEGSATGVRQHLSAGIDFQSKLARFLENHDEPRIASEMAGDKHRAAALITYGSPGLRFFHDGQLEGFRRKPSIHLRRREREAIDPELHTFYLLLLGLLAKGAAQGDWRLLEARRAWDTNWTDACFLCFSWSREDKVAELIVVNFSDHRSQCLLPLSSETLRNRQVTLRDSINLVSYSRNGNELVERGLYLDLPPWGAHFFTVDYNS